MKKLIKSGVCGTYEQCIYALFTKDWSTVAVEEKKKKKRKRRRSTFKCYPNIHHIIFDVQICNVIRCFVLFICLFFFFLIYCLSIW